MPYIHNDDLLLTAEARKDIETRFPGLFPAVDDADMRALFAEQDAIANDAKRISRRLGLTAVALVVLSLWIAAADPLYRRLDPDHVLAWVAATAGIVGAGIGSAGIVFSDRKWRWLRARLATERIRQFHFQSLLANLALVVRPPAGGSRSDALTALEDARIAVLSPLRKQVTSNAEGTLDAALEGTDNRGIDVWITGGRPTLPPGIQVDATLEREFLAFYGELRIDKQRSYSNEKLKFGRSLANLPVRAQERALETIGIVLVVVLILLHFAVLAGVLCDSLAPILPQLHVAAISVAVLALAVRTLDDGLKPRREVERYRGYLRDIERIRVRFTEASTLQEKFEAMCDLEEASVQEMLGFLETYSSARWVM